MLTVKDLAQYLHCHPATIYRLAKAGELPAFRLGGSWRFNPATVEAWVLKRMRTGSNDGLTAIK